MISRTYRDNPIGNLEWEIRAWNNRIETPSYTRSALRNNQTTARNRRGSAVSGSSYQRERLYVARRVCARRASPSLARRRESRSRRRRRFIQDAACVAPFRLLAHHSCVNSRRSACVGARESGSVIRIYSPRRNKSTRAMRIESHRVRASTRARARAHATSASVRSRGSSFLLAHAATAFACNSLI